MTQHRAAWRDSARTLVWVTGKSLWSTPWSLETPHHDKSLRSHIGTHPDILAGLVRNDWTMQIMHALVRRVKQAVDDNKSVAVICYCTRNRHRVWPWAGWFHAPWEFLKISCSLTHANARTSWAQMSGGCRGRCDHCQHVNTDAKTEAEDHAGKLCDMARCEMSEKDMDLLDEVCEVRVLDWHQYQRQHPQHQH